MVELVAVAGITALTTIATPNIVRFVREGQVDEAKALLNTAQRNVALNSMLAPIQ